VADQYRLMASGSSIGDDYGPMIVTKRPASPESLKGKRIAVPGKMTTAFLAMKLFEPDFVAVVVPFDKIIAAVLEGSVDAGLIIHEGQLTYSQSGLSRVIDLGVWFKANHGLPLPLGANALRRDLPDDIQAECCRLMRDGIQYSLNHREEALAYAMTFARDMETRLADRFVGMYVNHYTVDCGDVVPRAAQKLLDLGYEAGVIPRRVEVEFVR
jgi:1,4-dihydroxy-6-naphthoate synthase